MKKILQISSLVLLVLLGTQLCGISNLFISLDNTFEISEIEDSDKEEKDEKEEDIKLFNSSPASVLLNNDMLANKNNCNFKPSNHPLGIDTPPPELV